MCFNNNNNCSCLIVLILILLLFGCGWGCNSCGSTAGASDGNCCC